MAAIVSPNPPVVVHRTSRSLLLSKCERLKVSKFVRLQFRLYTRSMPVKTIRPPARRRQRTVYLPESIDKKVRVRAAQLDTTVSVVVAQIPDVNGAFVFHERFLPQYL